MKSDFIENIKLIRTISLPAQIDVNAAIVLKSSLMKLINEGGRKIIYNFLATDFISETGAKELINIAHFLAKIGGELGICQIKSEVKAALLQPHLFRFYSVEESVAIVILKNLVMYFEQYEDIFDIKVHMENAVAHVEIYIGFVADQLMGQVQQTVDHIRNSLEQDIKDVKVLIVPTCLYLPVTR